MKQERHRTRPVTAAAAENVLFDLPCYVEIGNTNEHIQRSRNAPARLPCHTGDEPEALYSNSDEAACRDNERNRHNKNNNARINEHHDAAIYEAPDELPPVPVGMTATDGDVTDFEVYSTARRDSRDCREIGGNYAPNCQEYSAVQRKNSIDKDETLIIDNMIYG